jgi:acyl-CoA synthetase (AMP-forming)/AMP-acid ligase II
LGKGDVVFVILRHSPDLLYAFLGALLAGCIPSFLAPISEKQNPDVYWPRLAALLRNIGAAAAIVGPEDHEALAALAAPLGTRILTPVEARMPLDRIVWPDPEPDETALLQFSSGTTGLRKGVMLSHRSVLAQIELYSTALSLDAADLIATWLPLYHDMGLIACFILPLVTGTPIVMLDAFEWVARPIRLFQVIARHRATLVWLPNFAFNHLAATVPVRPGLDLSSVRAFINCSEPCKIESIRRFAAKFAAINARPDQLQACYAMAEAVFAVTQTELGREPATLIVDRAAFVDEHRIAPALAGPPSAAQLELVSTGRLLPGIALRVLGPDGDEQPPDRVGELAIQGPSMFDGYYRSPQASAEPFRDGWYLTGDLGFVRDGEVFVTGRAKDIIIVYGKNFYSHDIEDLTGGVDGVKPGRAVAFGVYNELAGSESVVICAETDEPDADRHAAIAQAVKATVSSSLDLVVGAVVMVPPRWLIKTSSGKISRAQNRDKYLAMLASSPSPNR